MLRDGEAWELLKTHHLTEQKTAKIIGTSQAAVSLYLRRRVFPRRAVCLRFARLLKKLQAMPAAGDLERNAPPMTDTRVREISHFKAKREPGTVVVVNVLHDEDCAHFLGRYCDCAFEVVILRGGADEMARFMDCPKTPDPKETP
jgi:hypothetical protein